ncbi:MAG: hypothetical protein IKY43_02595 [Bacteroidales bacterium]|nr:hypothetical protein [Bacteroidales bacterium]
MKSILLKHCSFLLFIYLSNYCFSQCEPWCQGEGGYYITHNANYHSLWWHRHQKQEVYKKVSPGTYLGPGPINDIIPLMPPEGANTDVQYYYNFGLFYMDYEGGYIVVPAPIGYTVPNVPYDTQKIKYKNVIYNYYAGTFFLEQENGSYITVLPPLGISVSNLPPNSIMMNDGNGAVFYRFGKTYYQPVNYYGYLWYQVVRN